MFFSLLFYFSHDQIQHGHLCWFGFHHCVRIDLDLVLDPEKAAGPQFIGRVIRKPLRGGREATIVVNLSMFKHFVLQKIFHVLKEFVNVNFVITLETVLTNCLDFVSLYHWISLFYFMVIMRGKLCWCLFIITLETILMNFWNFVKLYCWISLFFIWSYLEKWYETWKHQDLF